ncbi:unnamed protein product [Symbiodinium necroappetens]|uniref:Uncharacterized protein n=1 Tax=Symbiodinium necroappetens TaxID=1628268 RepID=A0A812N7R8_9DINO|nr:unnamed protein product [Symbiodinium necroappetens]
MGLALATAGTVSLATVPTDDDVVLPDDERLSARAQPAYVLIVGKGMMSHWASVWIFEDGSIYSMELSAIENTGRRWVQCKYKMRHLKPGTRREGSNEPEGSNSSDSVEAILADIGHESASTDVHKCLVSFLKQCGSGHYIMTRTPIRIDWTSPWELRNRASAVPLHGGFYDLLFHNCQVFLIQLLCNTEYKIDAGKLPTTVGSVAAAPTLLILEVCFVALYMNLRHHDLPEVAGALGVLWIAAEMFLTSRYRRGVYCIYGSLATLCLLLCIVLWWPIALLLTCCATLYAPFLLMTVASYDGEYLHYFALVIGGGAACMIGLPAIVFHPSATAAGVPLMSLVWDLCMVLAALEENRAANCRNWSWVLVACVAVALLQWSAGLPIQVGDFDLASRA